MRTLFTFLVLSVALVVKAAYPSFDNFNPSQFSVTGYQISILGYPFGGGQTNISWTGVTNIQSAEMPYTIITNSPWQHGDSNLTNWAQLNTNVLSTLGQTNISVSAITNAGTAAYSNSSAFDLSGTALNATNKLNTDLRAYTLAATNKLDTDLRAYTLGATNKLDTDLRAYTLGATNKLDTDLRGAIATALIPATNVLFYGPSAFASATNSLVLTNDYASISTGTDISITNVTGQVSGQYRWTTLWVSNSAATAITARYLANGRAIGTATTNALIVAAAKMGTITVQSFGLTMPIQCNNEDNCYIILLVFCFGTGVHV